MSSEPPPPTRNWSVWHTLWTGAWLVSLAGMLYGYLSRNAPVTGASLFASLVPPPVLVFLEWRAKRQRAAVGKAP